MVIGSESLGAAEPYLIQQDWLAYTPEQHATWAELVGRRMPRSSTCMRGISARLSPDWS